MVDLQIHAAEEQGHNFLPFSGRVTAELLYHQLTKEAWSLFSCWNDSQAQERLVPEVVRREKQKSISKPVAFEWNEIKMPEKYDIRDMIDELGITELVFQEFDEAV